MSKSIAVLGLQRRKTLHVNCNLFYILLRYRWVICCIIQLILDSWAQVIFLIQSPERLGLHLCTAVPRSA